MSVHVCVSVFACKREKEGNFANPHDITHHGALGKTTVESIRWGEEERGYYFSLNCLTRWEGAPRPRDAPKMHLSHRST